MSLNKTETRHNTLPLCFQKQHSDSIAAVTFERTYRRRQQASAIPKALFASDPVDLGVIGRVSHWNYIKIM